MGHCFQHSGQSENAAARVSGRPGPGALPLLKGCCWHSSGEKAKVTLGIPWLGGGWGKECLRVICQALRSKETSSLEMTKKLALLVPGVPRSHGAELSKCRTVKSPAESFKQLP